MYDLLLELGMPICLFPPVMWRSMTRCPCDLTFGFNDPVVVLSIPASNIQGQPTTQSLVYEDALYNLCRSLALQAICTDQFPLTGNVEPINKVTNPDLHHVMFKNVFC